ncbi:hypothetical protein [Microbacterium sp.]|uniref:hypothetical protein n=1 Tax=Microbacterium sp. TaxID=51671 RepID=UPI0039E415DE
MTPKSIRTRVAEPFECTQRLARATGFWESAENERSLDADPNAIAALYVLAGIAAADAICCRKLGEYSRSESHDEAISLIKRVSPDLAAPLRRLLADKSLDAYGAAAVSARRVEQTRTASARLIEAARTL